ncbi:MAG: baseplate J/gp47 family protein [Eubacteriales bacterium]
MEIDGRTQADLVRILEQKATAYVPEWRFDRENPDLGTTLALIYSQMFAQTLKRYNQVPEKNRVAFFSALGVDCAPPLPAQGFVTLGLAGDVDSGEEIPAGTPLLADGPEGETLVFETQDDILVTSAQLLSLFTVCGAVDYIGKCYEKWENQGDFYVFSRENENQQHHQMELSHLVVLQVSGGGQVTVALIPNQRKELDYHVRKALGDCSKVIWEYSQGEQWHPFASQSQSGNCTTLQLDTPAQESGGKIRLRLAEPIPSFSIKSVTLGSANQNLLPDHVYASGVDGDVHEFFPFGEQLGLFAEGYFGCDEALIKCGAQVEMDFHLDFVPIPVEYDQAKNPINWKLVMKKQDFPVDEAFDIAVQEVIWEYFNGTGWARLFPDNRHSAMFSAGKGALSRRCNLSFICPADIRPSLVGSAMGYYIRARVLKVSNLYKFKGHYIAPLVSGTRFSYEYQEGVVPELAVVENNCQTEIFHFFPDQETVLTPFAFLEDGRATLYFRFSAPPTGGPVKLLVSLLQPLEERPGRLLWQYATNRGWETLSVVDQTDSFRQTGVLSLLVGGTMAKTTFWGEEGFWIRAIDEEGRYFQDRPVPLPHIGAIYENTTTVANVVSRPEQRFFMEPQAQNFTCNLDFSNLVHCRVLVNEWSVLTPSQMADLTAQGLGFPVLDDSGVCREFWVEWEMREDFDCSTAQDRHCTLDKNQGIVAFSDGSKGKIPPAGKQETIAITYATGGGAVANVAVGAINRGQRAMGYVSRIGNPRPTVGGCDRETLTHALERGGAMVRHGDRAVTARDFEHLALEATRAIVRAKCFPNRNHQGDITPGQVTLVVLLRDYMAAGDLFPNVRNTVSQYIASRTSGNLTSMEAVHVVAPRLLELSVKVEIQVAAFNHVFGVRQAVRQRLDAFLNPLTGNFDSKGWPIGQIPKETQIRNCLSGIPNMVYLEHISITAFTEGAKGRRELTLDDLKQTHYALPTSGEHQILVHLPS